MLYILMNTSNYPVRLSHHSLLLHWTSTGWESVGVFSAIANFFTSLYILSWDTVLVIGNIILPNRPAGLIVPDGHPGFRGQWPEYVPAKEGDSRCSCPALNALANHGEL